MSDHVSEEEESRSVVAMPNAEKRPVNEVEANEDDCAPPKKQRTEPPEENGRTSPEETIKETTENGNAAQNENSKQNISELDMILSDDDVRIVIHPDEDSTDNSTPELTNGNDTDDTSVLATDDASTSASTSADVPYQEEDTASAETVISLPKKTLLPLGWEKGRNGCDNTSIHNTNGHTTEKDAMSLDVAHKPSIPSQYHCKFCNRDYKVKRSYLSHMLLSHGMKLEGRNDDFVHAPLAKTKLSTDSTIVHDDKAQFLNNFSLKSKEEVDNLIGQTTVPENQKARQATATSFGLQSDNETTVVAAAPAKPANDVPIAGVVSTGSTDLVIPEKSSSFSIHPGRMCSDVCMYCNGKFGMLDTPMHVCQLKSIEKQTSATVRGLALDACICDKCYRYLDRGGHHTDRSYNWRRSVDTNNAECVYKNCDRKAEHFNSKHAFNKMYKLIKQRNIDLDVEFIKGLHVPVVGMCSRHYVRFECYLNCGVCRRSFQHGYAYNFLFDVQETNELLKAEGFEMHLNEKAHLCKMCRSFLSILVKKKQAGSVPLNKVETFITMKKKLCSIFNMPEPQDFSDIICSTVSSNMSGSSGSSASGNSTSGNTEVNNKLTDSKQHNSSQKINVQASLKPLDDDNGVYHKYTTTLQFDTHTQRIWRQLQYPHGNISSFLRHLIRLEQYFRSGDLALSSGAADQAVRYIGKMRNRLNAFEGKGGSQSQNAPKFKLNNEVTVEPISKSPSEELPPSPDFTLEISNVRTLVAPQHSLTVVGEPGRSILKIARSS